MINNKLSHMSQTESVPGNTRNRARSWFITYNNCELSFVSLVSLFSGLGNGIVKFVGQRERGESGTIHMQCVVQFKQQVDFGLLKTVDPGIHYERVRNLKAALAYCTKTDTRVEGPWAVGWSIPEPIWCLDRCNLTPWQQQMEEIVTGPIDPRAIYWCWESTGGVGKTAFTRYCALRHGALVLGGRAGDIKFGVQQWIKQHGGLRLAVFHFTRTNEMFTSYEAIEAVKDGIFFSGKYESGMCVFNPPTIICFANYRPDESKLSADRWRIYFIGSDRLYLDGENPGIN